MPNKTLDGSFYGLSVVILTTEIAFIYPIMHLARRDSNWAQVLKNNGQIAGIDFPPNARDKIIIRAGGVGFEEEGEREREGMGLYGWWCNLTQAKAKGSLIHVEDANQFQVDEAPAARSIPVGSTQKS